MIEWILFKQEMWVQTTWNLSNRSYELKNDNWNHMYEKCKTKIKDL